MTGRIHHARAAALFVLDVFDHTLDVINIIALSTLQIWLTTPLSIAHG